MNLTIPETATVFRRVHNDGRKGPWHILKWARENGFGPVSHPEYEDWWRSVTYHALCKAREDSRTTGHGYIFDGHVELSTVGEIKKVCPSCWPYGRLT